MKPETTETEEHEIPVIKKEDDEEKATVEEKKKCGIIMPIAGNSEYSAEHWKDVLAILYEAVESTGTFMPNLVSNDLAVGLIHDRIVSNIYSNEMVICDVSSKNPNVMFELGMRLAFDKPTIVIKDNDTTYSFDTTPIEHLLYPRSLRFADIVKFKEDLIVRIEATYERSQREPDFSPFLKSFGRTITPSKIKETPISEGAFILAEMARLSSEFEAFRRSFAPTVHNINMSANTNVSEDDRQIRKFDAYRKAINKTLDSIPVDFYRRGTTIELMEVISKQLAKEGTFPPEDMLFNAINDFIAKRNKHI